MDLGERPPVAVPQRERSGIVLPGEGRGEPQRVQLARAAGRRLRADLLPDALEQRDGQRVTFRPEPLGVVFSEGEAALDGRAPRHQGRGRAGDDGDPQERPAPRRRHDHAEQRREPQEGVPLGPRPVRAPEPEPGHSGERGPSASRREHPGGGDVRRLVPSPHKRRREQHERHGRRRQRRLPRQPQADAHATRGRRDAAAEVADQVRSSDDEQCCRRRRPPAARAGAAPHDAGGGEQQHRGHEQGARRRAHGAEDGAVERGGREQHRRAERRALQGPRGDQRDTPARRPRGRGREEEDERERECDGREAGRARDGGELGVPLRGRQGLHREKGVAMIAAGGAELEHARVAGPEPRAEEA